jgi:DNA sulfur modification protein DndD
MFIREIGIYNFGVFAGPERIIPCISSEGARPVTIIGGVNGSGKTTILEAVLLALYGKSSPAVNEAGHPYQTYIESYMRTDSHIEAWIELSLDVPVEGKMVNLRLRRQWHKKKTQWVETFKITRNDVPDLFLAQNWAYYVEDLVPSGLAELFFFDGEKIMALAEEETSDAMKKAIYDVFGVNLVDRLIQDMDRLIKRHENHLYPPDMEKEIYHLESNGENLLKKIGVTRQELAGIDTRLDRLLEKARQKEEKIMKSGGRWDYERQNSTKEILKERLIQLRADMISLAGGALPLALVLPALTQLEQQMKQDRFNKTAVEALPLLDEQGSEVLKLLKNQEVSFDIVNQIKDMLNDRKRRLTDLAGVISPLYISELALNQVEHLTMNKLRGLMDKSNTMMQEYRKVESELEQVERHLLVEIDSVGLEQEMQDYKYMQQEITDQSVDRRLVSERLSELNRSFAEIEKEHQKLLQQGLAQIEGEEEAARIIQYAIRTKETMQYFREKLIERKTARLNSSMQEAFQYLAHKKNLAVRMEIDPKTLNIRLYDRNGKQIAKQRLAAGEKQMLAISLLWGLAHSSGRILPVIIDTPLGRLDSTHRQNFVDHYLPFASHQVIVLSTDTEIIGDYCKRLRAHVGKEYYLNYSDQTSSTIIQEGYFCPVYRKEGSYDHSTNQIVHSS